jgi:uncharacterized protein (TIRG00374 family)
MFLSKQNFSRLVLFIILVIAAWYITAHLEEFKAIQHIQPKYLWPILICVLMQNAVNGYMNKEYVRYFDIELDFTEWFGLAIVGAMGNYLTPLRGGAAGRAIYLKKKHDLPYTRFMTLFIASYLVIFFLTGVLGAITMMGVSQVQGFLQLFGFFVALSGGVLLFVLIFSRINLPQWKIWAKVSEAMTGWKILSANKEILWRICAAVVVSYFLVAIQMYYAFLAFGFSISPIAAWLVGLFSTLGLLISITPGSLGIQEALVGLLAAFFGIGFNQGVIAQGLIRVVNIVIIFSLGPLYSYFLTKKLTSE